MLRSGFNCLPLWWQSNMAMEQVQSPFLLMFWPVLLLEALQGLKRNCSAKCHLYPCHPWHMTTDKKEVPSNEGCHVHIRGKKIATAISYWGIWESSAPKPVPWGWPSVATEPAPNPLFLSMTVEKLVVRRSLQSPVTPCRLMPSQQVVTDCPVWAARSWWQGTCQHRELQWPYRSSVWGCDSQSFLWRCCSWGPCSCQSRVSNVTSSCFALAMWILLGKRIDIWCLYLLYVP